MTSYFDSLRHEPWTVEIDEREASRDLISNSQIRSSFKDLSLARPYRPKGKAH